MVGAVIAPTGALQGLGINVVKTSHVQENGVNSVVLLGETVRDGVNYTILVTITEYPVKTSEDLMAVEIGDVLTPGISIAPSMDETLQNSGESENGEDISFLLGYSFYKTAFYPETLDGEPVGENITVDFRTGLRSFYSHEFPFGDLRISIQISGEYLNFQRTFDSFLSTACNLNENNQTECHTEFMQDEYNSYLSSMLAMKAYAYSQARSLGKSVENAVLASLKGQPYPARFLGDFQLCVPGSGCVKLSPGYIGTITFNETDIEKGGRLIFSASVFDRNGDVSGVEAYYIDQSGKYGDEAIKFPSAQEFYSYMATQKSSTVAYAWMNGSSITVPVILDVVIKPGQVKEGKARVVFVVRDGSGGDTKEVSWDFVFAGNVTGYSLNLLTPKNGAHLKQIINGLFSVPLYAEVKGSGAKDLYAVVTLPDGSSKRLSVDNGEILDVIYMSDPSVKEGTLTVSLYGKVGDEERLLVKKSIHVSLVSAEVPGDEIDNDMDGLTDCDDPDIATCDACILQKKLEWAESLMERHIDYINKMIETDPGMKVVYDLYIEHLRELHEQYKDDPDRMVKEMNAYMEEKVYRNQEINRYLSIFADDPEKRYKLRQIAEKYRYDPIQRRIAMRRFIYENSESEAEREATMNAILTGILEPPKWLVGGQYGSGGALDWANFVASNFEKVGDTVKLKGTETVKMLRTPVNVFLVAQDARALMKQAEELKKMNLPENTKVSIIVLDGATKIGKLLDPTGYFGNMADATIGSLVNLRKKIEERNQGWFTWNGYVLHETAKPGIYEDYETGRKFKRISGGWLSPPTFVEVKENG
ncbi:hypothetical protein [Palaeococcus ferrophilus]|uniref:hypothetical protein n=1 Tax=Palaeococcus ferrophilus TaxID=83868 RepID=UPI001B80033D|nr:hypothetical protein [Palaeococcus ferrophilus]